MRAHPATSRNTTRVPVFALLGANSISQIGNMLTMVALPWFVLQTTGSPAKAGMVGFAVFLPGFAAGIFGGTLVDRLGFKRVSVLADGISGVGVAAIPLLYHTVGLAFWQLLTLVFIGALLDVPGLTARRSMLPELTEHANMRLERVNAAFESINNLALLIGAPIAGLLIAWFGASNVLWLDAASFVASALLIATLVPRPPLPATPRIHGRYVEELMAGLRFIRREQLLFPMAIVLALSNGLSGSLFAIVLPVYAAEVFGNATNLGLMVAASGAGALGGAALYGSVGHKISRSVIWLGSFMLMPIDYWVLSLSPSLSVLMMVLALSGAVMGPINPLMVTIRHERSPAHLRGRVFSTYSAIAMAVQPLGILAIGYLIERLGLRPTVILIAVGLQTLALGMLFLRAFRTMEKQTVTVEDFRHQPVAQQ
ncbi:MAG: MFS transporter [Thermomicrobiales bacterium]